MAPAVPRVEGGQSLAVGPGDPVGHGVAARATRRTGGLLVVGPVVHRQEPDGAGDAGGRGGGGSAQAGQCLAPVGSRWAERLLPAARHGKLLGS